MNSVHKTKLFLTIYIVSIISSMTLMFGIFPKTVQAYNFTLNGTPLPESTPGNFTVTWYSAKKYYPGQEPGTPHAGEVFTNLFYSPVDKDRSDAALASWDTSVCTGQEQMSNLIFDMKKWQPDRQYWTGFPERRYDWNWNWCEVQGLIKLPEYDISRLQTYQGTIVEYFDGYTSIGVEPLQRSDVTCDLLFDNTVKSRGPGEFVPFRLRIKCSQIDQSRLNTGFSVAFNYTANVNNKYNHQYVRNATGKISAGNPYGTLALKDMQPYFQLDKKNYTIYLDPQYNFFPVEEYEYGYAGSSNFKTLALGTNYLPADSGDVIVRYKLMNDPLMGRLYSNWYITLGTIKAPGPGQLTLTGRTPTTASLVWTALTSENNVPIAGYDIYRRMVGKNATLDPSILTISSAETQLQCVGSSTNLTFTDQNLQCINIYEYFVKARYSSGGSSPASNTVRTDSLPIPGLPYIPNNIKADYDNQTASTSDLRLYWDKSQAASGIKEYVLYRKVTAAPLPSQESNGGVYVIGGISDVAPREIWRTSSTSFVDKDLAYGDKCQYYVQAVDNNGIPSYLSRPLELTIIDTTPPTAPGDLQAGDVLRQGNSVQYVFPQEPGMINIVLGPQREVTLRWQPSTDNVELVGYDIYRSVTGWDPNTNTYWGKQNVLAGSTKDTSFMESGLEFGATYTYVVVAKDAENNKNMNSVCIGTEKSVLADLLISNDSQSLTPEPVFTYYQTEYNLNVENAVKSINLKTVKMDSLAKVLVNGRPVADDGSICPLALDPGKNVFNIDVIPRKGAEWFIEPETMRYTLTINRANLDNLPVLTLPADPIMLNEGDIYRGQGQIVIPDKLIWTGAVDYGDGSGEESLQTASDGSFKLEHKYLDNGLYKVKVSFRYKDLGLVTGTIELNVENVAPSLTVQETRDDEIIAQDGILMSITGNIVDPGQDTWKLSGDYGSEWGPVTARVNEDKSFTLKETFYDQQPVYDMLLTVLDDDGGSYSMPLKIRVENVAPSVQASGPAMVQIGSAYTGSGAFVDPGPDKWQATVDFGDGSGPQSLSLMDNKTFDLKHIYLKPGIFTVNIRIQDQDGGAGEVSLSVKAKEYLLALEGGEDISINEGDTLDRRVPVYGRADKIKSISVDYGDGAGEEAVVFSKDSPTALLKPIDSAGPQTAIVTNPDRETVSSDVKRLAGWLTLQHIYKDNGSYAVKIKLIDVDGDSYEDNFQSLVANVSPSVELDSIPDMYVGTSFTGSGRITDPGADTWTAEIHYKDGSAPDKVKINPDNSFTFSHTYTGSGYFDLEATVQDDDGGFGYASQQLQIKALPSGGGSRHDADLHSFAADGPIVLTPAFSRGCLNYTIAHPGMNLFNITITVARDATVKYTNGGAAQDVIIDPNTLSASFMVDLLGDLSIEVTSADTFTTHTYFFDAT